MSIEILDQVLAIYRDPSRVAEVRDRPLAEPMAPVIKVAAGDTGLAAEWAEASGAAPEDVTEACVFFLQQILFAPGADAYRVLGASADAPQARLREHYGLLMRWLHPDRNSDDGWEQVYADRVNQAWQELKTPARRAEYDGRAAESLPAVAAALMPAARRPVPAGRMAPATGPVLSGGVVRRLPAITLGALGLFAAAVVGVMYWAKHHDEQALAAREQAGEVSAPVSSTPVAATAADPAGAVDEDPVATGSLASVADPDPAKAAIAAPAPAPDAEPAMPEPVGEPTTVVAAEPAPQQEPEPEPVPAPVAVPEPAPVLVAEPEAEPAPATAPPPAPVVALPSPAPTPTPVPASSPSRPAPSTVSDSAPAPAVAASPAPPPAPAKPPAATPPSPRPDSAPASAPVPASMRPAVAVAAPVAAEAAPPAEPKPVPVTQARPEPVAVAALVPPPPREPAPAPVAEPLPAHRAEAVLKELVAAYAAGDSGRFDRLFSDPGALAAMLSLRERLRSTDMRFLQLGPSSWSLGPGQASVRVSYKDTWVPRGGRRAQSEAGTLELRVALVGDEALIAAADMSGTAP